MNLCWRVEAAEHALERFALGEALMAHRQNGKKSPSLRPVLRTTRMGARTGKDHRARRRTTYFPQARKGSGRVNLKRHQPSNPITSELFARSRKAEPERIAKLA